VDARFGDLADHRSLVDAAHGVDCVLRCAANTGPWGPETAYKRANVWDLKSRVEAAQAAGVQRFVPVNSITVSVNSITVHGNDVRGTADETAPLRAEPNLYCRTKVEGERLQLELIHKQGAPITIVRPGWIYGPRDAASFARFATLIRDGKMMIIGSGASHIPLIYVRNAAEGVTLASAAPDAERTRWSTMSVYGVRHSVAWYRATACAPTPVGSRG
jgi:nucleoside-diphosphate-sugar epimerase